MQLAVEEFADHVDECNIDFKRQVFEKVKELKHKDTKVLHSFVSLKHLSHYWIG